MSEDVKWGGILEDCEITAPSGKRVQLQAGDVVELPTSSYEELKKQLGDRLVNIAPGEVLKAFGDSGSSAVQSSIRYVICGQCKGIPAPEDAVTACHRCGGRGRVLHNVPRGKPKITL